MAKPHRKIPETLLDFAAPLLGRTTRSTTRDTKNAVHTLLRSLESTRARTRHKTCTSWTPRTSTWWSASTPPGGDRIAQAVRTLCVPAERHVRWKIKDAWGGDQTEYEASALAVCKAITQLRKHVEQATNA